MILEQFHHASRRPDYDYISESDIALNIKYYKNRIIISSFN